MTHWGDTRWASWGLAGLILASLVVFGVLGCQNTYLLGCQKKTYPPTPIVAPGTPDIDIGGDLEQGRVVINGEANGDSICATVAPKGGILTWEPRSDGHCYDEDIYTNAN